MKNIKLESCEYSDKFLSRMYELNKEAVEKLNIDYIKKGLAFAKYYHGSQMRKSGEPYYTHPIIVAEMVAEKKFKEDSIIGALLHDTVEDTTLTSDEIKSEFSPRVSQIVDRLTRKINPETGKKMSAGECLIQSFLLKDDDVILIKMLDRFHNISTIKNLSIKKQIENINETNWIFFPIALTKNYNLFFPNIISSDDSSNLLFLASQNTSSSNNKQ